MAVRLAERLLKDPIRVGRARPKLMEKFVIEGGVPLSGTMVPAGNKNGALPILAASMLTDEEVVVRNVPRIRDVEAMLEILRGLGVSVAWRGANEVVLCAQDIRERRSSASSPSTSARRSCSPDPCSLASAAP